MTLSAQHQEKFKQFCGLVLPGRGEMPNGSTLGIELSLDDRVLARDCDLRMLVLRMLDQMDTPVDAVQLQRLESNELPDFRKLVTVACAAYYGDPVVRKILGYSGQQALTLEKGGFGAEELVLEMMEQPKRYRDPDC